MDEFQKEEEFLFEENEENIVIKYKLLRSLIIKHYNRGCKYLEIAKVVCAAFFLIFLACVVDNLNFRACQYLSDYRLLQISCKIKSYSVS